MSSRDNSCEHGCLARSCEVCELTKELKEADNLIGVQNAEIARMRDYLTRLGYDHEREIPLEEK